MNEQIMRTFAVRYNDPARIQSASGGLFPAVAKYILEKKNGYVCGCVLENMKPIHIVSSQWTDVQRMQDSKYVQSSMGDCYKEIAHLLKEEKWVLFTGTSCQVAGLINYLTALHVSRDNLLTMDFFCHGVPSPKIWHDFLKFYESEKHHTPVGYRFRGKKYGWRNHHHHLIYREDDREDDWSYAASHLWNAMFFSNLCLRPSCYKCNFATYLKPADITMGDFWGIDTILPEFYDNMGCSVAIVRNHTAMEVLDAIENLEKQEVPLEDGIKKQANAFKPSTKPEAREAFWNDYRMMSFKQVAHKYFAYKATRRLKCWVHRAMFQFGLRKDP